VKVGQRVENGYGQGGVFFHFLKKEFHQIVEFYVTHDFGDHENNVPLHLERAYINALHQFARKRLAVSDIVEPAEVLQGDGAERESGGGGRAATAAGVVVFAAVPTVLTAQSVHKEVNDFLLKAWDVDFEQHANQGVLVGGVGGRGRGGCEGRGGGGGGGGGGRGRRRKRRRRRGGAVRHYREFFQSLNIRHRRETHRAQRGVVEKLLKVLKKLLGVARLAQGVLELLRHRVKLCTRERVLVCAAHATIGKFLGEQRVAED
jgi:hypothetical protein